MAWTLPTTTFTLGLTYFLYILALTIFRVFFSNLARFPGPRLAAATYWYEFYYDAWPHQGQYEWKIRDLHARYGASFIFHIRITELTFGMHHRQGAFVRINPDEVHCNDPNFFNELYASSAKRRTDKTIWQARQS